MTERGNAAKERLRQILAARKENSSGATNGSANKIESNKEGKGATSGNSNNSGKTLGSTTNKSPVQQTTGRSEQTPRDISATTTKTESNGSTDGGSVFQLPSRIPSIGEVKITHTPIEDKLRLLQECLVSDLPELPTILKTIHMELSKDFDTVQALSEDEIGLIVAGLLQHTSTSIVPAPKKATVKKSQPVSLDMLD